MFFRTFLFILIFVFRAQSWAAETSEINRSVRALGMGNAFTAVVDDHTALFYNPAGLSRVTGINLRVFGINAGAGGVDNLTKLKDLKSEEKFSETVQELYGEQLYVGAGGGSFVSIPGFAAGVYDHLEASIQISNPVYPTIDTNVINDLGYTAGFGLPIGPFLAAGMNLRYIKRTGARGTYSGATVADLDSEAIVSDTMRWGRGYAADIGANLTIPAPLIKGVLSAVWKNVGETQFKSENGSEVPSEPSEMIVGAAVDFDAGLVSVTPAIDFKYLNRDDLQLARKINFGIEIGLPLLDIRGGFSQGYYTAGAGVNLGLFQVNAATYGVELGEYPGQIEDRRYVIEFSMDLGIGNFSVDPNRKSTSGGSGGGSRSIWGGRRLKQRR